MKIVLTLQRTFEGHEGRPGLVGGSLPKGAGGSAHEPPARMAYEPTPNQLKKWSAFAAKAEPMPTDEEFKAKWAKGHHGKVTGWGVGKRDWILHNMTQSKEYQMGIWQGRVDKGRGIPYSEERSENTYNLGYHRGYTEYESNRQGWDQATRDAFDAKYLADLKQE